MEAAVDAVTLLLAFVAMPLVLIIMRPHRNWRDRPYAVTLFGVAGTLTWTAATGFSVIQHWDQHVRIVLMLGLIILCLVWVGHRGRSA